MSSSARCAPYWTTLRSCRSCGRSQAHSASVSRMRPRRRRLQEIIWAGQAFLKGTQGISGAIWPLFFTGIYYLIFSGLLTLALGKLEKKLDYFKA